MTRRLLVMLAIGNLRTHTMRTSLTVLGVVIGISAAIIMVAVANGADRPIPARMQNPGTNVVVVTPRATSTVNRLTVQDVATIKREARLVTAVSPLIAVPTQVLSDQSTWPTEVNGVAADYLTIRNWTLASGVPFDDDDVRAKRKFVLLGSTVAHRLFPDTDPFGEWVRLGDVPFTVVGVLAAKGQTATGTDQDDIVLVPYTTAQDVLTGSSVVAQIVVNATGQADIAAAEEELRDILRNAHTLRRGAPDDFTIGDQTALAQAPTHAATVMTGLLATVALISLVVGGIAILNMMLVSVTERTREIGIRAALGARGSDLLDQFLIESIVLCVLGGVVGLGAGAVGAAILGHVLGWHTSTPIAAVLVAVGVSAAVGLCFGYYPARQAATLDPVRALRHE
jgi:putative ABC transport system permease protein